jgi:hypothetical protein
MAVKLASFSKAVRPVSDDEDYTLPSQFTARVAFSQLVQPHVNPRMLRKARRQNAGFVFERDGDPVCEVSARIEDFSRPEISNCGRPIPSDHRAPGGLSVAS